MGRRALPKIDRSINFSDYIREIESIDPPFNPRSLFPVAQDIELEIGSGKGHFVLTYSEKNPQRNYLGNEVARKYADFAAYRLAKHKRDNARILQGDGLHLINELMPDSSVVAVHVYFPDPWWKDRHRKRRVIQPLSVKSIERIMKPKGVFHFWTDVEQYFEEACETVTAESGLSGPHEVEVLRPEHDMDYRTHFERRMRKNGHDVFRAEFKKT